MPRTPSRLLLLLSLLTGVVRADVGATLSVQTDARERGMSYSNNQPSGQLGLAWDGEGGWYAGVSLSRPRFTDRIGLAARAYGGRVFALQAGLDAEAGVLAYRFENVSSYDFFEAYAALLGERWNVRVYVSPDYYGIRQRSGYVEFNLRWPLAQGVAAVGHVGVLRGWGGERRASSGSHGPVRIDWRAGASWQLGDSSELQLLWVAASRGGPYTWTDASRRRTAVLNLTTAF